MILGSEGPGSRKTKHYRGETHTQGWKNPKRTTDFSVSGR
jgi:hypothetical protein